MIAEGGQREKSADECGTARCSQGGRRWGEMSILGAQIGPWWGSTRIPTEGLKPQWGTVPIGV